MTVRMYAMPLVTLTPRINIPYARTKLRGFSMARRARANVLDPPETPGKDKETRTGFATGSISFVNQTIPDPSSPPTMENRIL